MTKRHRPQFEHIVMGGTIHKAILVLCLSGITLMVAADSHETEQVKIPECEEYVQKADQCLDWFESVYTSRRFEYEITMNRVTTAMLSQRWNEEAKTNASAVKNECAAMLQDARSKQQWKCDLW